MRISTVRYQLEKGGRWQNGLSIEVSGDVSYVISRIGRRVSDIWDVQEIGNFATDISSLLRDDDEEGGGHGRS